MLRGSPSSIGPFVPRGEQQRPRAADARVDVRLHELLERRTSNARRWRRRDPRGPALQLRCRGEHHRVAERSAGCRSIPAGPRRIRSARAAPLRPPPRRVLDLDPAAATGLSDSLCAGVGQRPRRRRGAEPRARAATPCDHNGDHGPRPEPPRRPPIGAIVARKPFALIGSSTRRYERAAAANEHDAASDPTSHSIDRYAQGRPGDHRRASVTSTKTGQCQR